MTDTNPPVCAEPDRHPRAPGFTIPAGAVDCHAHVFAPDGRSALDSGRSYSPSVATIEQYDFLHRALGIERGVVVQPSVYGSDNRTTLDVVQDSSHRLRGIVVVDQDVTAEELLAFHSQGARGVRVNMLFGSSVRSDNIKQLAITIREAVPDWHLQLLTDISQWQNLFETVSACAIPVVFDHMGHMSEGLNLHNPGFQDMLRLLGSGQCWVKLSAPYRFSKHQQAPYHDVDELASLLVAENPERLLWGSDWPHPSFNGEMPNDGALLDELLRWVPDEKTRQTILVDNPERLYDF